jgi:predicted Holliday junction resolvase-like endonuclease
MIKYITLFFSFVTAFLLVCCFRLNQKVVSLQGQVESDKVKIEYMENQVRIYEYTLDSLGVKY